MGNLRITGNNRQEFFTRVNVETSDMARRVSVEAAIDKLMDDDFNDHDSCSEYEQSSDEEVSIIDDPPSEADHELESTSSLSSGNVEASSTSSSPVSLLSVLRPPKSSELSRKQVVNHNPPKGKKRAKGPNCHSDPKFITPEQRLMDARYANECLIVSNKKLFCHVCREKLSVKASVINNHIKSAKHKSSKTRLDKKQKNDVEIVEAMKAYDTVENPKGETLPQQHQLYRIQVVHTFLLAGVPLTKLCIFRDLLEEHAYRLTDRRHMSDLIPFILQQEKEQIKKEINGKPISVTFDGTTRLGEVFVITVRFASEWSIQQRLIRLQLMMKTMTVARTLSLSLVHCQQSLKLSQSKLLASCMIVHPPTMWHYEQ